MEEVCKLIENSKVLHPVAKAAQIDSRYWRDFLDVMRDYKAVLNESQFYVSLLFLNPQKEHTDGFGEYYFKYAVDIFGFCTRDLILVME